MPDLSYEQIHAALAAQPLFEAKSWQLSPQAWPLTRAQIAQLEAIGAACVEFQQALETLYLRSAGGRNLLRNRPLLAPWVADYLDRGKPPQLVAHARDPRQRGAIPQVLRPDLLLTDEGFVLTELDSVPGGIGLTAFLNRLYAGDDGGTGSAGILGQGDAMIHNFHAALAALRPELTNPLIAIVISDEAATYRPEMEWLAAQLQVLGRRVFCVHAEQVFPLGATLCLDIDGNPEKIDVVYRFFELFDLENIRTAKFIFEAWAAGEVAVASPMRHFQEEKLALALFHHHLLQDFWAEALSSATHTLLRGLIPPSWIVDPAPLPPGAVLDGPRVGGRALNDWRELAVASKKERELILKISGYHETAWGARSVVLGSDCSREEWQQGLDRAIELAPTNLHILQTYRKPRRVEHPIYELKREHGTGNRDQGLGTRDQEPESSDAARAADAASHAGVKPGSPAVLSAVGSTKVEALAKPGRLRLCPYYFVVGGEARLSGALATFCPPDKKIIHGMQDAALLPARVVG